MSYCLNPKCPQPADPANATQPRCVHCGCELLLQGRYRIVRPLGGGGFGKTFEVDDRGTVKVLKVLLQNHEKAVELFQQEADVLRRVKHPGIPKVDSDAYFTFVSPDSDEPLHCLVMEKIHGLNLREWLKKRNNRPISEEQAIDWLKQLSEILAQVHRENFFHRDIKPLNIMIKPNGQLVLIDFGAAREVTSTYFAKVGQGQNITGIVSPGYTPPEQANGKAVPQSDFYAIGRTFVYLVTGQPPTAFSEHPRTGKLVWRNKAPQISKPVGDIIDYLMSPFPGKRPQNCQMILQCLAELELISDRSEPLSQGTQSATFGGKNHTQTISTSGRKSSGFGNIRSSEISPFKVSSPTHSRPIGMSFPNSLGSRIGRPLSSEKTRLKKRLSWIGAVLLLGLGGSQLYGYSRYGLFPANPIQLITSLPSSSFLERTLGGIGEVQAIALSPVSSAAQRKNEPTFVSGSFGTIKVWNLKAGKQLYALDAVKGWVTALAISPDGQMLVSGSSENAIQLWNLKTGTRMLTIQAHSKAVNSIAISPDGEIFASGSEDKTIRMWDLRTGTRLRTLYGHEGAVNAIAFSPDGRTLASGSEDKTLRIWDVNTGSRLRTLRGHRNTVLSVAFNPDGRTVASGSKDKTVRIWSLRTGKLNDLLIDSSAIRSVAFTPDGETLATASESIEFWDLSYGKAIATLQGHARPVNAIALSSDGQTAISASSDRTIKIWRVPPTNPPPQH